MKEKRSGKWKSKQGGRILESSPKELRKQFERISKEISVSMSSSMKLHLKDHRLFNADGELKKIQPTADFSTNEQTQDMLNCS